jgi:hypothetical protein
VYEFFKDFAGPVATRDSVNQWGTKEMRLIKILPPDEN